jgi:predicted NodU family carbamoyl transferase
MKSGKNFYSVEEVETLIDEFTQSAKEEIERAAAEAAKAAALASIEREAAAIAEARKWKGEYQEAKTDGIKNTLLAGALCLVGGVALGVIINNK